MRSALENIKGGFTLIELLIVISIIAIITGAAIPSFDTYIRNQNVKQAQEQVKDDLRTVQNRALNGQEATKVLDGQQVEYWGVRFEPNEDKYTYFTSVDTNICGSGLTTEDYRTSEILPGGSVIKNLGTGCVFFNFANGDAEFNPSGFDTIIVGSVSGSECKRVEINSSGLIKTTNDTSCF